MADSRQLVAGVGRGRKSRPDSSLFGGRLFENRLYFCKTCGHRNIVARWVDARTGRVLRVASAWRGRCGECTAYLGWQDRV